MLYSSTACWFSVSYSILFYAGSMIIFRVGNSFNPLDILPQTGIFSLLIILFAWIIAPPQKGPSFLRVRTSIRLVISSCVLLSVCIPIAYSFLQNEAFYQSFLSHLESILSIMPFDIKSSDAVDQSLIERYLTPDVIARNMFFLGLRGGALASIMVFLFLNRQISLAVTTLIRGTSPSPGLSHLKIKISFIWLLSFSILSLLVSFLVKWEILEIIAWNIFVICVMVYAAQGFGIVLFLLQRRGFPRGLRILLNLLFIFMIFRFSVMMVFLALMTILGIIENWVPLRVPNKHRPPSTPEV